MNTFCISLVKMINFLRQIEMLALIKKLIPLNDKTHYLDLIREQNNNCSMVIVTASKIFFTFILISFSKKKIIYFQQFCVKVFSNNK